MSKLQNNGQEKVQAYSDESPAKKTPLFLLQFYRKQFLKTLEQFRVGEIHLHENNNDYHFGQKNTNLEPIHLYVTDERFYVFLMSRGAVGLSEAYMLGYWYASDLTAFIQVCLKNYHVLHHVNRFQSFLFKGFQKMQLLMNQNTINGSLKNIQAHYDLSNQFFSLFLDKTMMYSAAHFEKETDSLYEASQRKIEMICEKLSLEPFHSLLEIGSGWGSLAIYAAKKYGCRVKTVTLSQNQFAYVQQRIKEEGVGHLVDVSLQDYRHVKGKFDRIVSVEMIEAVGWEFYQIYFGVCSRLLKNNGIMVLQGILIDERRYEKAKNSMDFIKKYIFPGSCIPSLGALYKALNKSALQLYEVSDLTKSYATTLRKWRENFMMELDAVKDLGFDESFIRMWEYYLCYCEGGFLERAIQDVQMTLVKPEFITHNENAF